MNANTALLFVAISSFLTMSYVISSVNGMKKDISNGVVKIQDSYYLCKKLETK